MNKQGFGFLTISQNTAHIDYLRLAYAQACNLKAIHREWKYAVILDQNTKKEITNSCKDVFDFIIDLPHDENEQQSQWKLANEYQVFNLSPFKETIKVEADLVVTRPIDHWLTAFRFRDVVLSFKCKNYRQEFSTSRTYRHFFDDNDLPDIYSGLMYFRYSVFAQKFFNTAKQILDNWSYLQTHVLKNCRENTPSTDVLYSLTSKILGVENCTIPSFEYINFVHMKPSIQGWADSGKWQDMTVVEQDNDMIRIHNLNQYHPIHYHEKDFINLERLNYFERRYRATRTDQSI